MSTYVIGLTGNIATGKSTVAGMLERLGAEVLDADKLAHRVMRAGTEVYHAVVQRFGPTVVEADGEIDRAALGQIVFADSQALSDLEALVHPAVIAETRRWLGDARGPVAVVEAIKLLEAGMRADCDAVWVVTSPRPVQEERLRTLRGLTGDQAQARIDAQSPQEAKVRVADRVIDNGGTLADTWRQVLQAWNAIPGTQPVPEDTPWGETPPQRAERRWSRGTLCRTIVLGVGMALLVLLGSASAGLSTAQRFWFALMGLALGLACSWMIGWE